MQRASASYTFGRFHLDSAERRLSRDGQAIPLTPKAFDTLLTLVQNGGHALTKDELMRAVWPDGFVEEVNLAYNISILRKALADGQPGGAYIETVPKLGYRFVAPVRETPSNSAWVRKGTNLPAQLTSFIGREREIVAVKHSLGANRLATLTGSGGVGKSRLALQVASKVLADYRDGVWWIELAPLSDSALVPHSVVTALGLSEGSSRPILEVLSDFLRDKKLLLVLDNCEHLIEACARLADALLRACPNLTILATSREPLGIDGETVYRVPSLSFPDPQRSPQVETLMTFDAVRLFVDRAMATESGFEVTSQNAEAMAVVCRRLDGIPLAIELAAARVSVMPIEQIAARLDDCFHLLTGGNRTSLPRHKTLRALIDWSYDLLSPAEQTVLCRLSVFADGWTLEAAEAVAGDDIGDVLDELTQLVNKSLVIFQPGGATQARYRMLETIRQYVHDKLLKGGELETTHDRHLEYFLRLAERAEPELRRTDQIVWLDRLEGELDNFRAALGWALVGERNAEAGMRLATVLLWFWHIRDHKREGGDWLERALSAITSTRGVEPLSQSRSLARAHALNAVAFLLGMQAVYGKQIALAEEALTLARTLGELGKRSMAFALWNLAAAAYMQQNGDQAKMLVEGSLALYQEAGDKFGVAECYIVLGRTILNIGDFERAREICEMNVVIRQEMGDVDGLADAHRNLGEVAWLQGDLDRAATKYKEALALSTEAGHKWGMRFIHDDSAGVALARGEYEQAESHAKQALALGLDIGDKDSTAFSHFRLARIAWSQGNYEQLALHYERALTLSRDTDRMSAVVDALCGFGNIALVRGDHEQASKRFEDALIVAREMGGKFAIAVALFGLGRVAQVQNELVQAHTLHHEALALRRGTHAQAAKAYSLDALACVAAAQGQGQRAAQLFGAGEKPYQLIRYTQSPFERELHERGVATARAQLDEAAFAEAWAEGQRMTVDEAVALALDNQ